MLSTCSNAYYDPQGGVTAKYTPLNPMGFTVNPQVTPPSADNGSEHEFDNLEDIRSTILDSIADSSDTGLRVRYYCTLSAQELLRKERENSLHPILVISSNRSEWIEERYRAMRRWINHRIIRPNQGSSSQEYFPVTEEGLEPIPIYFPERLEKIGAQERSVYMFVHKSEYNNYLRDLRHTGITIIGWECAQRVPPELQGNIGLVGFGMSRAVVVGFAKLAFKYYPLAWRKAWLVDDNVCYLKTARNSINLVDYENEFRKRRVKNCYFYGFKSDNNPQEWLDLNSFVANSTVDNLIQQMVLMNIQRLVSEEKNFSPFFIFSNEDYSLIQYLSRSPESIVQAVSTQIVKGIARNNRQARGSLLDAFKQVFVNDDESRFRVYDQKEGRNKSLSDCVLVDQSHPRVTQKVIQEVLGQTCAKAVEQMFRMSLSSPNRYLPSADYFADLFDDIIEGEFIQTQRVPID